MLKYRMLGSALAAGMILAGCGGGGGGETAAPIPGVGAISSDISIPNFVSGVGASTDLGTVSNLSPGLAFFTDRNNSSVDVIDIATNTLIKQITGTGVNAFAGCRTAAGVSLGVTCVSPSNPKGGPNGITLVPGGTGGHGLLYVGDVTKVMVIDVGTLSIITTITGVGTVAQANRADEGCYDPDDKLVIYSSNADSPPVLTLISTVTNTIVGKIVFSDPKAGGIEQCRYDTVTQSLFLNNDGTTANPQGELDKIPRAALLAIPPGATVDVATLAGVTIFPLGECDGTGLALGPGTDIAVGCRPSVDNTSLDVKIFDRTKGNIVGSTTNLPGALVATVNAGGGDQLEYDPVSNRYFNSASRWNATGKVQPASGGACTAAALCTPRLIIIDAATRTRTALLPTGNNAHGIAFDPVTGKAYMPYSAANNPATATTDPSFTGTGPTFFGTIQGGVSVFNTR